MADPVINVEFKISGNLEQAMSSMANSMERMASRAETARKKVDGGLNNSIKKTTNTVKLAVPSFNNFAQAIFSMTIASKGLAAGMAVVRSPITAFTFAIDSAVNSFGDFEKEMANFRSIAQPTEKDLKSITKQIEGLGATTVFTSKEVAVAATELARLGRSAKDIEGILPGAVNLAIATQTEIAEAAKVSTVIMNQFGLEAKDSSKVADLMTAAFSKSALSMDKLRESMRYIGPNAAKTGVSLKEVTSALAVLADQGIQSSIAGTGMRQILLQLSMSSSKAGKELKKLGVDVAAPLSEKIHALGKSGMGSERAFKLFGKTALSTASVLFNMAEGVDYFNENLDEDKILAFSDNIAAIQLDTLSGDLTILNSRWEAFRKKTGEAFSPEIRNAVSILGESIDRMLDTMKTRQGDIKNFAKLFTRLAKAAGWAGEAVTELAADWGELLDRSGAFDSLNIENASSKLEVYQNILERIAKAEKDGDKRAKARAETERDLLADKLSKLLSSLEIQKANNRLLEKQRSLEEDLRKNPRYRQAAENLKEVNSELEENERIQKRISEIIVKNARRKSARGQDPSKPKTSTTPIFDDAIGTVDEKAAKEAERAAKLLLQVQERYIVESAELEEGKTAKKLAQLKIRYKKEKALLEKYNKETDTLDKLYAVERDQITDAAKKKRLREEEKERQEISRIRNEGYRKDLEDQRLNIDLMGLQRDTSFETIDAIEAERRSLLEMQRSIELQKLQDFEDSKNEILQQGGEKALVIQQVIDKKFEVINKKFQKADLALEKQSMSSKMALTNDYISFMGVVNNSLKTIFGERKEFAIADAIINTAGAVTKALNSPLPPPLPQIQAGIVGAAGAVQVGRISAQSFNTGGIVQGTGIRDKKEPTYLTPGEGVLTRAATNRFGPGGINAINDRNVPTQEVTNNVTFAPVINSGSREGIIQELRAQYVEFGDFLKEQIDKGMVVI